MSQPINQTTQVPPVAIYNDVNYQESFPFLTPDTLMVYCEDRLKQLDGNMGAIFDEQKGMNAESEALNKLAPEFARCTDGCNSNGQNPADYDRLKAAVDTAIASLPDGSPVKQQLQDLENSPEFVQSSVPNVHDNIISKSEMDTLTSKLGAIQKNVDSRSQMNMLKLQSSMSSRQEALQMVTNLIQALGDTSKALVANIGK